MRYSLSGYIASSSFVLFLWRSLHIHTTSDNILGRFGQGNPDYPCIHLSAFLKNNINIITVMYLVKDIHILSKEHNSFPVVMVQKCKNCRCKVSIGKWFLNLVLSLSVDSGDAKEI